MAEYEAPKKLSQLQNSAAARSSVSDLYAYRCSLPESRGLGINLTSTLKKPKHWTRFKWTLLFANTLLFSVGICSLILSVLTWFKLYLRAEVILVISGGYVILVTTVSSCIIVIGVLGYLGIFFNNRKALTFYCLFLWPLMAGIASVGYVAYKRQLWNLEAKLQSQWRTLSNNERQRVQSNLHCCGYLDKTHLPAYTNKCFPRTTLPGCRGKLQRFMASGLRITYITAFAILPAHLFVIFAGLLCSNHITNTFGRESPPKINHRESMHQE